MSTADERHTGGSPLGYAIKYAQHALRLRMDAALRPLGITTPQYSALTAIAAKPGISNAQLARQAFVTPQTMQAILAGLERDGLLIREPDPDHGRVLRSQISSQGAKVLASAQGVVSHIGQTLVEAVGEEQSAMLVEALNRAAGALARSQ